MSGETPSKSRVDRAGERLRKSVLSVDAMLDGPERDAELDVLAAWRARYRAPLAATVMGLRSAITTSLGHEPVVRRRLKREEQIIAKLVRPGTHRIRLSQMEDIAGCRAIIRGSLADLRRVAHRVEQGSSKMDVTHIDDYVHAPRSGGYRAIHLHGVRSDVPVEIQLRTTGQHMWAQMVENWDEAAGHDVKHERAPEPVLTYFRALSMIIEDSEMGHPNPEYVETFRARAEAAMIEYLSEEESRG